METFKERLLNEKIELDSRIQKLDNFLDSNKIDNIDSNQITLLNLQVHVMKTYSQILLERILLLEK